MAVYLLKRNTQARMPPPWWSWLILAGIITIYVAVSTADAGMGLSGGTVLFVWNQPLLDKHDMIIAQFPVKDWAIVNKGKM